MIGGRFKANKDSLTFVQLLIIMFGYAVVYRLSGACVCLFDKDACRLATRDNFGLYMIGAMFTMAVFTVYGIGKFVFKLVRRFQLKRRATFGNGDIS